MAFPQNYTKFDTVIINHSLVGSGGVTNFDFWLPVSLMSDQAQATMRSDGGDVRFTLNDDVTQLATDAICNTSGSVIGFRVNVPTLHDDQLNTIKAWYNGTDTLPAASSTYGAFHAYDSDTIGYWPMVEDLSVSSTLQDRTVNQLHGVVAGTFASGDTTSDGIVFDGTQEIVVPNTGGVLDAGSGDLTVEAQIKSTTSGSVYRTIAGTWPDASIKGVLLSYTDAETFNTEVNQTSSIGAIYFRQDTINDGNLKYLCSTYQSSSGQAFGYVNNATGPTHFDNDRTGLDWASGENLVIAGQVYNKSPFIGTIGRMRWDRILRSAAWRTTRYNNESNPQMFVSGCVSGENLQSTGNNRKFPVIGSSIIRKVIL